MNFENAVFRRLFSVNLRKKLRIRLAEMSFENDFTITERGNLYPAVTLRHGTAEAIENGVYSVSGGCLRRLICEHFPFAEYSFSLKELKGKAGFAFLNEKDGISTDVYVRSTPEGYSAAYSANGETFETDIKIPSGAESVSFGTRGQAIDIYYTVNGHFNLVGTLEIPQLDSACNRPFPFKTLLYVEAQTFRTDSVLAFLDNGSALADIKPVKYIDGTIMLLNGRVYFTMSSRRGSGGYQSVISWLPGTDEFRLEGVIFFDVNGRGRVSGDIASCLLYDEEKKEFLIWMCAFSSGHILACGKAGSDLLHGVSVVEVKLMDVSADSGEREFYGLEGDEDPDFYYDAGKEKWYLSICRLCRFGDRKTYSYVKFESDSPFTGYRFCGATEGTGETGGMTAIIDGRRYFMCGAEMSETSTYRIYDAETLKLITKAQYDYPDGGFRGWGTLVPVQHGSGRRVYQITFDRVLGSDYNWSYGNLYLFEAIENARESN